MSEITYSGALGTSLGSEPPERIVYMPLGVHEVMAGRVGGKPGLVKVQVGPELVPVFQAQLAERLSRNVRPFIGYDHKSGPAAAIPKGFSWDAELGILVEVEWTASGRAAVAGRDYSYFSPTWRQPKSTASPSGIPMDGEIGSLTNDPAFEEIRRLAASRQSMETTEMETLQAAATQASAERDAALSLNETLTAERDALVAERDTLRAERDGLRKTEAETLAASAARDGRIAEGERPRWAEAICRDPEARTLLAALPVRANAAQQPIHQGAKAPEAGDVLVTYQAMKPGSDKDAYLRANAAEILAAERAAKS